MDEIGEISNRTYRVQWWREDMEAWVMSPQLFGSLETAQDHVGKLSLTDGYRIVLERYETVAYVPASGAD